MRSQHVWDSQNQHGPGPEMCPDARHCNPGHNPADARGFSWASRELTGHLCPCHLEACGYSRKEG